jgi:nitroimidazol reductase NimA-like FMN-containing flavoprotein (pyridoxamine 5'-phosphate oxidase superfamily)
MDEEIRQQILTLLDEHRTIATLRPDGWPQAITVGYGNDGLTLYFLCGPESQKAANLARDDRVSLTIDHDTPQVMDITGLSMAARATVVVDPAEGEKALRLLMRKYPPQDSLPLPMPTPADVRIFRVTPTVIAVLDYSIRPTFMIISGWRDPPGHASRIVHTHLRKETEHYGGRHCRRRGRGCAAAGHARGAADGGVECQAG